MAATITAQHEEALNLDEVLVGGSTLETADRTPAFEGCCCIIQEPSRECESGLEVPTLATIASRCRTLGDLENTSEVQAGERIIPDIDTWVYLWSWATTMVTDHQGNPEGSKGLVGPKAVSIGGRRDVPLHPKN